MQLEGDEEWDMESEYDKGSGGADGGRRLRDGWEFFGNGGFSVCRHRVGWCWAGTAVAGMGVLAL